jgi:SNF2 family DNA or RNA helicase
MTLAIAQLGAVRLMATDDGLAIQSTESVDLTRSDFWPKSALKDSRGLQTALEIEQCLELGYANSYNGEILIPYQSFPEIRRSGIALTTRWAEWCPFLLKIDRINDIGRTDFRYKYSFIADGQTISFKRTGYFGRRAGDETIYQVDDQTFALVSEMDRFNELVSPQKTRSESWLVFSRVKECASDVGASLDRYLQSNDVVVPKSLQLNIHEWPDGSISFAPQVSGVPRDGLRRAFFHSPTVEDFYSVDGPDNSRVRVVFDHKQTEVLERMKSVHRVYGKLKEQLLEAPESVFEGVMDAVDVRYGRRVEGIGPIESSSIPGVRREKSVLGDDSDYTDDREGRTLKMTGPDGESINIRLSSSRANDFIAEASHAVGTNQSTFVFDGQHISVDDSLREFIKSENARSDQLRQGETTTEAIKKYLLPYRDEEDLRAWDVADSEDAKQPLEDMMPFISPTCLSQSVRLKKHQEDGVRWLQACHRLRPERRGSLLADDMGLGKTLQVLTYLAWCIEQDKELRLGTTRGPWRPILLVVPLILLENKTWEREIEERFSGSIFNPILTLHGSTIKNLRRSGTAGPEVSLGKPVIPHDEFTKYRVVITNYQTLVNYQHSFAQLLPDSQKGIWSIVVTDEAQEYKAPPTKVSHAIKALHPDIHIACTGTPVENRLLDLWNLIDTIQPALLGTAQTFRTTYERDNRPLAERLIELKQNLLFGKNNAFVLRRDKSEVLDLPPKKIVPLLANMSDWEIRMHQDLLATSDKCSPLKVLHKFVALYQHPFLLEENKEPLDPKSLVEKSSKLRLIISQLREIHRKREKVVIFAYRIEMQQILAAVISSEFGIHVNIVNGVRGKAAEQGSSGTEFARQTRDQKLKSFRESLGFDAIILSPFVASVGLTITEANHVIHYGRWWNPAVEAQATDRVYRIGQEKPVFVYLPILHDPTGRVKVSFDQGLHALITEKNNQAQEFLTPLPNEDALGQDLFGRIGGQNPPPDSGEPLTSESVDALPPHLFESLVACLLEKDGYKTILTCRSNDHGADALCLRDSNIWLVQVKHTKRDSMIGSLAMSDLIAARMSYSTPLSYSVGLMAVTNGNFSTETQKEASQQGILLMDRRDLMAGVRACGLTMGRVYNRESDRCQSYDEGIRAARRWFNE